MTTIKNIIFDFGDVFINLQYKKLEAHFRALGILEFTPEIQKVNHLFEKGLVSEQEFLNTLASTSNSPNMVDLDKVKFAWNQLLEDIPLHRLYFLESLKGQYKLYLLSNTDSIHIEYFRTEYPNHLVKRFFDAFNHVYLSYQMHQRKPDAEIFETVLKEQQLIANETLFVDDKLENVNAAKKLGIHGWHLQVGNQEVTQLLHIIKTL